LDYRKSSAKTVINERDIFNQLGFEGENKLSGGVVETRKLQERMFVHPFYDVKVNVMDTDFNTTQRMWEKQTDQKQAFTDPLICCAAGALDAEDYVGIIYLLALLDKDFYLVSNSIIQSACKTKRFANLEDFVANVDLRTATWLTVFFDETDNLRRRIAYLLTKRAMSAKPFEHQIVILFRLISQLEAAIMHLFAEDVSKGRIAFLMHANTAGINDFPWVCPTHRVAPLLKTKMSRANLVVPMRVKDGEWWHCDFVMCALGKKNRDDSRDLLVVIDYRGESHDDLEPNMSIAAIINVAMISILHMLHGEVGLVLRQSSIFTLRSALATLFYYGSTGTGTLLTIWHENICRKYRVLLPGGETIIPLFERIDTDLDETEDHICVVNWKPVVDGRAIIRQKWSSRWHRRSMPHKPIGRVVNLFAPDMICRFATTKCTILNKNVIYISSGKDEDPIRETVLFAKLVWGEGTYPIPMRNFADSVANVMSHIGISGRSGIVYRRAHDFIEMASFHLEDDIPAAAKMFATSLNHAAKRNLLDMHRAINDGSFKYMDNTVTLYDTDFCGLCVKTIADRNDINMMLLLRMHGLHMNTYLLDTVYTNTNELLQCWTKHLSQEAHDSLYGVARVFERRIVGASPQKLQLEILNKLVDMIMDLASVSTTSRVRLRDYIGSGGVLPELAISGVENNTHRLYWLTSARAQQAYLDVYDWLHLRRPLPKLSTHAAMLPDTEIEAFNLEHQEMEVPRTPYEVLLSIIHKKVAYQSENMNNLDRVRVALVTTPYAIDTVAAFFYTHTAGNKNACPEFHENARQLLVLYKLWQLTNNKCPALSDVTFLRCFAPTDFSGHKRPVPGPTFFWPKDLVEQTISVAYKGIALKIWREIDLKFSGDQREEPATGYLSIEHEEVPYNDVSEVTPMTGSLGGHVHASDCTITDCVCAIFPNTRIETHWQIPNSWLATLVAARMPQEQTYEDLNSNLL
jgi:hypothetical protein